MHHLRRLDHRQSAAIPGPASYGRGGEWATVTDADAVAGYPDPDAFAEGWTTPARRPLSSGSGSRAVSRGGTPRFGCPGPVRSTFALAVPFLSGP